MNRYERGGEKGGKKKNGTGSRVQRGNIVEEEKKWHADD